MGDEIREGKLFATFEKHGEFINVQQSLLASDLFDIPSPVDDSKETRLFQRLLHILDEYQEQSYLLDPFLEQLVAPVVECIKSHAKASIANYSLRGSPSRVQRVALLLYSYVKFRGYKTIIRFFPHEIADLSIALDFLLLPDGLIRDTSQWPLRYVVLIWLSLICMIPFDLAQFDDNDRAGHTADALETCAKSYIGNAGLVRDGAALLLSRLYMRKDTSSRFHLFLEWSSDQVRGSQDVFTIIGLLQVLCEVVKSGSTEQIQANVPQLFAVASIIEETSALSSNTTVRKYKTKLVSRIALRMLPARSSASRHKGRILAGIDVAADMAIQEQDEEIPEYVEPVLEQLFGALQDKDTIVRWSAAKGVARIAERLPTDFAEQVLETIMGLFAIHSIAAASLYDLPAIAESTWHGACLACAEIARRGLVATNKLPELIEWLYKALYFDLRKGAHSIGSNVRDASAYVLWALARTQDPSALGPHSENLARRLIAVALYDREIHIRRAASAVFQEHVGRHSSFPHGIDVLRKTDFYSVSIRRNAFLIAAPQVAEHPEYRAFLLNHILDVVLRHWDTSMRELGSQSLRLICLTDLPTLGPRVLHKAAQLLDSIDISDLHGGLLALSEVALAYRDSEDADQLEAHMRGIFQHLSRIPFNVIIGPRNEIVTAAACQLISNTMILTEAKAEAESLVPNWRKIVDYGLKHRSPAVQEAAADAMSSVSTLVDCSSVVTSTLIQELKSSSPPVQRSLGRLLGAVNYDAHPNSLSQALQCLMECVGRTSPMKANIEARRNCYLALPQILSTTVRRLPHHMSPDVVNSLYDALLDGLGDYTIDERGDVGSWIRMSCIRGLTSFSETLIANAASMPSFDAYFPPTKYHLAIAGILKQGVERLDNVRQEAGECFVRLLGLPLPDVQNADLWQISDSTLLKELFASETEIVGWNDGKWLFPKAVRLLEVKEYRKSVLTGLVLGLGSKTDSTQRPLAISLVSYVRSLPIKGEGTGYNATSLVGDLIRYAKAHITSNAVVVPVLQTFNVLLEGGALRQLAQSPDGLKIFHDLLSIVSRNVARIKSIPRLNESMKIIVNLLSFTALFAACVPKLTDFLAHQFPSIRRDTAEYLYVVLQGADVGRDTEDVEEILLETEWSSNEGSLAKEASDQIVALFLGLG